MATREGHSASELHLLEEAREVPVPSVGGSEYVCPGCERPIPVRMQVRLGKPPKYENSLNDVFRCALPKIGGKEGERCGFIFSPKQTAVVVRQ